MAPGWRPGPTYPADSPTIPSPILRVARHSPAASTVGSGVDLERHALAAQRHLQPGGHHTDPEGVGAGHHEVAHPLAGHRAGRPRDSNSAMPVVQVGAEGDIQRSGSLAEPACPPRRGEVRARFLNQDPAARRECRANGLLGSQREPVTIADPNQSRNPPAQRRSRLGRPRSLTVVRHGKHRTRQAAHQRRRNGCRLALDQIRGGRDLVGHRPSGHLERAPVGVDRPAQIIKHPQPTCDPSAKST